MIGRTIVGTARKVFGPAPEFFEPRPDPLVVDADWIEAAPERVEIGGNLPRAYAPAPVRPAPRPALNN